jgi:hypothetical protein
MALGCLALALLWVNITVLRVFLMVRAYGTFYHRVAVMFHRWRYVVTGMGVAMVVGLGVVVRRRHASKEHHSLKTARARVRNHAVHLDRTLDVEGSLAMWMKVAAASLVAGVSIVFGRRIGQAFQFYWARLIEVARDGPTLLKVLQDLFESECTDGAFGMGMNAKEFPVSN